MANAITLPTKRRALASVRTGPLDTPLRVLVYGAEKVGKSTFAAGAPSPLFLGADSGSERLDVARIEPATWHEAVEWVGELAHEKHDYKTLVVDPVNWLEPLCWSAVVGDGGGSIESFGGGYGKGYSAALDLWRVFVQRLEACWRAGMHVVLVAHTQVKNFQNPEGPAYDRYELAMNAKAAGLLKQWVDAVLFARLETFAKAEKGATKAKGFSTGARIMHTQPSAAYDAGSRWKLPDELPLSWADFVAAVEADKGKAKVLEAQIAEMARKLQDPELEAKVADAVAKAKGNADRLAEIANRLAIKVQEKESV
jgi:hypothetical protein